MRLFGQEAVQRWAQGQVEATEQEIRQRPHVHRQDKKVRWHTKFGNRACPAIPPTGLSLRCRRTGRIFEPRTNAKRRHLCDFDFAPPLRKKHNI